MITALDRQEVMRNASNAGLDGFLLKPVKESVLVDTIVDIFDREVGVRSNTSVGGSRCDSNDGSESLVGRHVLLVEDIEVNRDLVEELLADLGISVTMAVNGREGVEQALAGGFDLVLMDIQMPIMDGLTAARSIRADRRFSSMPIIAMTAHAMTGDRKQSLDAGMNDHLTKPIDPDRLTEALLRWIPARRAESVTPKVVTTGGTQDHLGIPVVLPPFDIQAALRRVNGKPALLRKLMFALCSQYAHAASDLRRLINEDNRAEAERLAHSLKALARTLEAADLGDAAFAVENAIRSGDGAAVEPFIERMESVLGPAISAAASLIRVAAAEQGAVIVSG